MLKNIFQTRSGTGGKSNNHEKNQLLVLYMHDVNVVLGGSTAQYRVTLLWIAASVDNLSLYHLVHFISSALLYAQKKERGKRRIYDRFLYGSTVDNSLG